MAEDEGELSVKFAAFKEQAVELALQTVGTFTQPNLYTLDCIKVSKVMTLNGLFRKEDSFLLDEFIVYMKRALELAIPAAKLTKELMEGKGEGGSELLEGFGPQLNFLRGHAIIVPGAHNKSVDSKEAGKSVLMWLDP